jgi:hypothetical protein
MCWLQQPIVVIMMSFFTIMVEDVLKRQRLSSFVTDVFLCKFNTVQMTVVVQTVLLYDSTIGHTVLIMLLLLISLVVNAFGSHNCSSCTRENHKQFPSA